MTVNEIDALVRRGESDTLEFKKTTGQLSRAAETICAFLDGRIVVCGVTPDKEIVGQTVSDSTLQDAGEPPGFSPPGPTQWVGIRRNEAKSQPPYSAQFRPLESLWQWVNLEALSSVLVALWADFSLVFLSVSNIRR